MTAHTIETFKLAAVQRIAVCVVHAIHAPVFAAGA